MDKEEIQGRQAMDLMYDGLFEDCIKALKVHPSIDLSDTKTLIRMISVKDTLSDQEPEMMDFWVDEVKYFNDSVFVMDATQAEQNVYWNVKKKGQIPDRTEVKTQIIVRKGGLFQKTTMAMLSLFTLRKKLLAISFPDKDSKKVLSRYYDEKELVATVSLMEKMFDTILDDLSNETDRKIN